jgi:catalase
VQSNKSTKSLLRPIAIIATVVGLTTLAFAYTAGWLSPGRLTPTKLVAELAPPGGAALGHRRNHAKGICFTGTFEANGNGSRFSTARVFESGQYPVVGRFNTAGGNLTAPDPMAGVRGFSTRIITPDGQEWRGAAIDAPIFAAATPQDFYAFSAAGASKNPNAVKQYIAAHPEIISFLGWAKKHGRSESWAETQFNSLDSFLFVDSSGAKHAVRWSFIPAANIVTLTPEELTKRSPDFLSEEISQRVATGPQRWKLVVTIASPGDPTSDPTKAWPTDRQTVEVGTLVVQQIEPEADGPCRDINYDPSVLPRGITTSDDPFPAARSAAYRVSHDERMAEESHYPHTPPAGGKQ